MEKGEGREQNHPIRVVRGGEDAEEQAGQPENLKVVVSIKGSRATISVQRTSSDPHIETFDDRVLSEHTRSWR